MTMIKYMYIDILTIPNDNFDNPQQQFIQTLTTILTIPKKILTILKTILTIPNDNFDNPQQQF